ncbi:aldose 1-epimerase, putative [Phytophthora infestans T30-4]|uniref:glucose-6-phosphate 1-epimerase n=1 Tax=Phytophthora infestans (strain T30-4) TaxID=403677 RepID=D0NRM9_PHYIT|nr:aldose 1-epimerase, putative [Phytophthora infestans T30-4]EEY63379.1 aldose 1-epimerase, putative [Phytophthora infestans T30-4]|eukprot:XP_002898264.1 aldose 1-epimerase, putative [Phytophthora infestans T30-4]
MVYSFLFKTTALVSALLASLGVSNAELETVKLTHPTGSSAEVFLFGAHVKSFRSTLGPDLDILFMSNQSHLDGVNPIRGGIPVVFPNFGSATGFPSRGFARITNWTLSGVEIAADQTKPSVARFAMKANDATRKMWPVDFELEYEVKLYSAQLETALHVHNTFTQPIDFHALLHNYIYFHDVRDNSVYIAELKGLEYFDKVSKTNKTETRDAFGFTAQTDSVYKDVPKKVRAEMRGANFDYTIEVEKEGSINATPTKTDVVIWNPWADRAKTMDDFSDEEYINMVAIEPGRVSEKQVLPAGQTYTLHQTISGQRFS